MTEPRQAIVHMISNGGTRSSRRLSAQFKYLSQADAAERDASREPVPMELSERYGGVTVNLDDLAEVAQEWFEQNGAQPNRNGNLVSRRDETTHIVVPLPPGTDPAVAHEVGIEWSQELFGSGRYGGTYVYGTFFHTDKPHPHTHVVVNRKALSGDLLRISRRNPHINLDVMREKVAEIASSKGIDLDATSRASRGLPETYMSSGKYRMIVREGSIRTSADCDLDELEFETEDSGSRSLSPSRSRDRADSQSNFDGMIGGPQTRAELDFDDDAVAELGDADTEMSDGAPEDHFDGMIGGPQTRAELDFDDDEVAELGDADVEMSDRVPEDQVQERGRKRRAAEISASTQEQTNDRSVKRQRTGDPEGAHKHAESATHGEPGSSGKPKGRQKLTRGQQVRLKMEKMRRLRASEARRRERAKLVRELREEKIVERNAAQDERGRKLDAQRVASLRSTERRRDRLAKNETGLTRPPRATPDRQRDS